MSQHDSASRYHIEVLAKLRQLKVFIWCQKSDKPRIGCKIDVTTKQLLVVLFRDLSGSMEVIRIEHIPNVVIQLQTSQITIQESITTVTFKIDLEDEKSSFIWPSTHPEGEALPLKDVFHLSCSNCGQLMLKQPSKIEKVSILPTEHWVDMRDLWTCACTSHLLEHRLPRSTVVRASPRTIQVGGSHLQLHYSDLDPDSISIDPDEAHTVAFHLNWKFLWCIRCGSLLGQAEMPNSDTIDDLHSHDLHHHAEISSLEPMASSSSSDIQHSTSEHMHSESALDSELDSILFRNVKLDKHMLKLDTDHFRFHRLETKVSADILGIISITGTFKIVLRDFRTRSPKLLLTILGWDSLIFSSVAVSLPSSLAYNSAMPSIRVIYTDLASSTNLSLLTSEAELLEYDNFRIFEILTLLKQRNTDLPPPLAAIGSQAVSYLHYIPPEHA